MAACYELEGVEMALVTVEYTVTCKQSIEWPDDEMGIFNYENLELNLNTTEDDVLEIDEITSVKVNGVERDF